MANTSICRFRSIYVFCGSSTGADKEFLNETTRVGLVLAERKINVVYDGGKLWINEKSACININ